MKKLILLFLSVLAVYTAQGQTKEHFTYSTTIGTGIPMSKPSSTPFTWQLSGHYNINNRFSVGAGTGLSIYEKVLIPVFADAKFFITRPHTFTPYLECGVGYAFAPNKNAQGGFYLNPAIGIQYNLKKQVKILLAIGYESQYMEQLKKYQNSYFQSEFNEKLTHHSISIKMGIAF